MVFPENIDVENADLLSALNEASEKLYRLRVSFDCYFVDDETFKKCKSVAADKKTLAVAR